jgi:hypothetical protein
MTAAPTGWELLSDPKVLEAIGQAWVDSLPYDSGRRHEEGGWICLNRATGELDFRRAAPGLTAEIDLTNPPIIDECVVVAMFHTHPNPQRESWITGPSDSDKTFAQLAGVPSLIRAEDAIQPRVAPRRVDWQPRLPITYGVIHS